MTSAEQDIIERPDQMLDNFYKAHVIKIHKSANHFHKMMMEIINRRI